MTAKQGAFSRRRFLEISSLSGAIGLAGCAETIDSENDDVTDNPENDDEQNDTDDIGDGPDTTDDVEEETAEPAQFMLDIIETDSPVANGKSADIKVEVINQGDESATQSITLFGTQDGKFDSIDVTLDGGEETNIVLTLPPEGYDHSDSGEATVTSDDDETPVTIQAEQVLELTDYETEEVAEDGTMLLNATVSNTADQESSAVLVGEIHIDKTHEARRVVRVAGNTTEEFSLKVRHDHDSEFFVYSDDARLIPLQDEDDVPILTADDLLVVRDATSEDMPSNSVVISAEVENLSDEEQSATLVGEISAKESLPEDFTGERDITIFGGDTEEFEVEVEYESDEHFFVFFYSVWIEDSTADE